jgi:hypothetical protein
MISDVHSNSDLERYILVNLAGARSVSGSQKPGRGDGGRAHAGPGTAVPVNPSHGRGGPWLHDERLRVQLVSESPGFMLTPGRAVVSVGRAGPRRAGRLAQHLTPRRRRAFARPPPAGPGCHPPARAGRRPPCALTCGPPGPARSPSRGRRRPGRPAGPARQRWPRRRAGSPGPA